MKLDIRGILATTLQTMRFRWRDYLVIAALPVALSIAAGFMFGLQVGEITSPPTPENIDRIQSNIYLALPLGFIVQLLYISVGISITRLMNGRETQAVFVRTDFRRQLWVYWTIIKIALYAGWPIWVAQLAAGIVIGFGGGSGLLVAIPLLFGVFAWRVFVFVRIIIALPANACDETLKLKAAYERTQGMAWLLIALLFLVPAAMGIIIMAFQLLFVWDSPWTFQVLSFWPSLPFTLINWVLVMFYFTLLAEIYRTLQAGRLDIGVEKPTSPPPEIR